MQLNYNVFHPKLLEGSSSLVTPLLTSTPLPRTIARNLLPFWAINLIYFSGEREKVTALTYQIQSCRFIQFSSNNTKPQFPEQGASHVSLSSPCKTLSALRLLRFPYCKKVTQ
jgi:hypothetical protein